MEVSLWECVFPWPDDEDGDDVDDVDGEDDVGGVAWLRTCGLDARWGRRCGVEIRVKTEPIEERTWEITE